jgi:hypothetical protein
LLWVRGRASAWCFSAALLLACGDRDEPIYPPGLQWSEPGRVARCGFAAHEIGRDEPTPFGVSAGEMLDWLIGEHRTQLGWHNVLEAFGPEQGISELTLRIEERGPARWVEPRRESPDGAEVYCGPELFFEVRMSLETSGGALAESMDTTLIGTSGERVSGTVRMDTAHLQGTFHNDPELDSEIDPKPALLLSFELAPHGRRGSLEYERSHEPGLGSNSRIAEFPYPNPCALDAMPLDDVADIAGVPRAEVIARLNAPSPVQLNGSSATLGLSFSDYGGPGCLTTYSDSAASFRFAARAALHASDGSIDGTVDVTTKAYVIDGAFKGADAFSLIDSSDPQRLAAAARAHGLSQLPDSFGGERVRFDFSHQSNDAATGGWLRALGLKPKPNCSPYPGDPCLIQTELFGREWGAPQQPIGGLSVANDSIPSGLH